LESPCHGFFSEVLILQLETKHTPSELVSGYSLTQNNTVNMKHKGSLSKPVIRMCYSLYGHSLLNAYIEVHTHEP
jgi:hypothetical protein